MPELQGFPALFQAQNTNVPIPGYLFSMKLEQEGTRRKVKPVWQVDVSMTVCLEREGLYDERTGAKHPYCSATSLPEPPLPGEG